MNYLITGGKGFIGSHIAELLLKEGHNVRVIDSGLMGSREIPGVQYFVADIRDIDAIELYFEGADVVFHTAAIARTPWCVDDPVLCYQTNVMGSINVLEAARRKNVKRVVLSSSNIVYAAETPYKQSKLAMEAIANVYTELYGVPTMCLRYSNVYGPGQREDGPGPNVFAAFRTALREKGAITITGDGEQSRDFTHVSDIARANLLAAKSSYTGALDLCTGRNVTMNYVAKELFKAPVNYIGDRKGDIKHIIQKPDQAKEILGWSAQVRLEDGIKDVL
ncbi:MAG TPA: NAD-dependent epimerase/dehydratase family protein [Candidatus Paceibacterota bacterium]|nr:NAD-dependent epimerase/dehydratase family protein [Candidatus Paceibacterota bacterium]